jgi:tetratricopeptide (TPR) repeat protein
MPRVGVYALAKNEAKHAKAWADSCLDADVRVVTDTGSTDDTVQLLETAGVTVASGYVCPWRWDEAHNLALHHLPPTVDVAIRLDLDERLQPGWRQAIQAAWRDGVNNLRYRYVWSWKADGVPEVEFWGDRVHARTGFRWTAATHEGLVAWACEKVQAFAPGLEIHHHRDIGKRHTTDLQLLRVAVRESPHDPRARWYLAREMDYAGMPEAYAEFATYLKMPNGQPTERSYARRILWRATKDEQLLHAAAAECPSEPDAWERLAFVRYEQKRWQECVEFAQQAIAATDMGTHATDPHARGRAYDVASVALWELGKRPDALTHAREAMARLPGDERIRANVAEMERLYGDAERDSAGAG